MLIIFSLPDNFIKKWSIQVIEWCAMRDGIVMYGK